MGVCTHTMLLNWFRSLEVSSKHRRKSIINETEYRQIEEEWQEQEQEQEIDLNAESGPVNNISVRTHNARKEHAHGLTQMLFAHIGFLFNKNHFRLKTEFVKAARGGREKEKGAKTHNQYSDMA